MNEKKALNKVYKTSSLKRLDEIKKLYKELELKEKRFLDHFCIHCQKGCGKCCENFIPDITELEAEYLAYGLIKDNKDEIVLEQLSHIDSDIISCPLYDKSNPNAHCTEYKFRPLVCRLFMASASKNKNGDPTFRNCKWNELSNQITDEDLKKDIKYVVSMSDFGERLEDDEIGMNKKELLPVALEKAINKIRFLIELEKESK